LTFQEAQLRLLAYVRGRIQCGDLTERRFARLIGISQPHAHNVLKGARNLSPEIFDSILKYFHMSLLDLAQIEDLEASLSRRKTPEPAPEVAFLESAIGPGIPWPARINWRRSFPLPYPSRTVPAELVMASLERDPSMLKTLAGWDIALLDTGVEQRAVLAPEGLYAVERNQESVLRYIRPGTRCFYLLTDDTWSRPGEWEQLRIPAAGLLRFVKARVRWLGRERDRDPAQAADQPGRFLYEAISS